MTTPPLLTHGATTIRGLDERDVQGCWEQCVDPLSVRWTQVPVPYGLDDAREFCTEVAARAWADGSQWIFAVEHEGRYAGNIALRDEGHGVAEVAYGAHPAARGTGAMEAAVRMLLEWGFTDRGLQTVVWRAEVGNWASRHLAHRLGFSMDGVLRRSHVSRGELVDAWVGTLLPGEPRRPRHRWLVPAVLDGDGVRLRPLREDDVPRVVEACSDERTREWLGTLPSPYGEADARGWLASNQESQARGTKVTWAVADPATDVLLAAINLFDVDEVDCEVGYWAHPEARGRGVVQAAVRAVTTWAFADLAMRRVSGQAALANTASRHVLEASGFRHTGTVRLGATVRSGPTDTALYDVLAEEWPTV